MRLERQGYNATIKPLHLTFGTDELKKLIAEHPDYPIVVLAGEDANSGYFSTMFCSDVRVNVEEILTAEAPYNDERVEDDRDEFAEKMEEWLWDELGQNDVDAEKMPEAEFQARLRAVLAEFEPYWQKVIAIYANN